MNYLMKPIFTIYGILVYLLSCFAVGKFWKLKGQSQGTGVFLSLIFSPIIGFLIGYLLGSSEEKIIEQKSKSPPYLDLQYGQSMPVYCRGIQFKLLRVNLNEFNLITDIAENQNLETLKKAYKYTAREDNKYIFEMNNHDVESFLEWGNMK